MLRGALSVSAGSTIAEVRQHSVVAQAHFPLLFRNVDHRIFGGLRARASGGGDRHERQGTGFQLTARSHHLQIVDHRAGGGDQRRNRLTGVNHRAAAEADHRSDPFLARQLDALLDIAKPGVRDLSPAS